MEHKSPRDFLRGLGHTLAALSTNCTEFQRVWTHSDSETPANIGLSGRWAGEWLSEANGHHGALRCVLTQLDSSHCRARFQARYAKFLRVCYSVLLTTSAQGGHVRLQGDADLGRLGGGVYHYDGQAEAGSIVCQYRCAYDHGTFRLTRLVPFESKISRPAPSSENT